ncbi:Ganglioside induced differentiation associated protein [Boothiomyces macroporosus]|uniref:Ganglioside induced differentiation associated protein n=1 Tax=Boothiomyces macroporosus TaxID=261099 RepID=A0AAD5Y2L6_9FUNG|nr:Ganglioside induced differentiation associated protein [Boothiomyces macroporosus]
MDAAFIVSNSIANNRIVVFGKSTCPYTLKTRELLEKYTTFELFLVDKLEQGSEILKHLIKKTGQKTVPFVFVDQDFIGGSSDLQAYQEQGKLEGFKEKRTVEKIVADAVSKHTIVIFGKTTCPYTARARLLLEKKNIDYGVFLVDDLVNGQEILDELKKLTGQSSVPSIFIKGKHIGGSSDLVELDEQGGLNEWAKPDPAHKKVDQLVSEHRIVVFGKSTCPYTKKAKDLLESKQITFETFNIDLVEDGQEILEYLELKTGQKTLPNIFIHGSSVGGSSDLTALNEKGGLEGLKEPELILYDHLVAYFPARARLMMLEKGYKFKHVLVDIFNGESLKPEFLKLNPKATLPVLVHGDKVIPSSYDIVEYLDNLDGKPLGGGVSSIKELVYDIACWDGNTFMAYYTPQGAKGVFASLNNFKVKFCEARAKENPELATLYAEKIAQLQSQPSEEESLECVADANKYLDIVEQRVSNTEYINGSEYTIADLLVTSMLVRIGAAGQLEKMLADRPSLTKWYSRMQKRPTYDKCFKSHLTQKAPGLLLLPVVGPALMCKFLGRC